MQWGPWSPQAECLAPWMALGQQNWAEGKRCKFETGLQPISEWREKQRWPPKLGLVPSLSQLAKPQEEERLADGNPVFQSPPLCSLPRDPVQTSTDLRYLVQSQNNNNPDSCMASIVSSSHFDVREGKEEARKKWLHFAFLVWIPESWDCWKKGFECRNA